MAYRIVFTDEALGDIESIIDFIADSNPAAAERVGTTLLDHIQILSTFPLIGSFVSESGGVRRFIHAPYRIYYRVWHNRLVVEVLHVWHGARFGPVDI